MMKMTPHDFALALLRRLRAVAPNWDWAYQDHIEVEAQKVFAEHAKKLEDDRDAEWRRKGHHDGTGGCFYAYHNCPRSEELEKKLEVSRKWCAELRRQTVNTSLQTQLAEALDQSEHLLASLKIERKWHIEAREELARLKRA